MQSLISNLSNKQPKLKIVINKKKGINKGSQAPFLKVS